MARNLTALLGALVVSAALIGVGLSLTDAATDTVIQKASAASQSNDADRTIQVSTSGSAEAEPDQSVIRVAVEARSTDPSTARSQVAENVSRMRDALLESGLSEDQIRTVGFHINEHRDHRPKTPETPTEPVYVATHTLAIELNDTERTGDVLDTAVDNGATSVHDVRFTLSEDRRDSVRADALRDAMAGARSQADTIAASADLSITGVNTVTTDDIHVPFRSLPTEAALARDDAASTELFTGPVTVTASVSVTYNATAD